jgi:UDP-N-acetylmuramate--alanine ligase
MLEKHMDQALGRSELPSAQAGGNARPRPLLSRLPRRIHMLGAGGAGMSGAARVLAAHGHELTGHDRSDSEHVRLLRSLGVRVDVSPMESARLPEGVELVVRSAAVGLDTPAVREAQERGIPVLKYSEALGRVTPFGRTLAVAGTHGKTTTSWMLHHALRGLAASEPAGILPWPGAIVGGVCRKLGTNAVVGDEAAGSRSKRASTTARS